MTFFERNNGSPKSGTVDSGPEGPRLLSARGKQRWDWHTFSGDSADMWDHSASCDICGHVLSAAPAGLQR